MSLRIAFDLDGVLADMDGALAREAEAVFGEAMVRRLTEGSATASEPADEADAERSSGESEDAPPATRLHMTARQARRLWRHVAAVENFWESLKEIEAGAVARLAALAAERRWEIIFLTKRPATAGATAQVQTQRWLEALGFRLPSVYVVQRSRGAVAAALGLDFVVDDTPENCLDVVVDSKARAVLVWRDDEKRLPAAAKRLGIGVVTSVDECLGILSEVEAALHEPQGGVVERAKQILGLAPAPRQ